MNTYDKNPKIQAVRTNREKANRVQVVEKLPDRAEEGDEMIVKNVRYTRTKGKWDGIDPIVGAKRQGDKIVFTTASGQTIEV